MVPLQGLMRLAINDDNKVMQSNRSPINFGAHPSPSPQGLIARINLPTVIDVMDADVSTPRSNNDSCHEAAVKIITSVIFAANLTAEQRARVRRVLEATKEDGRNDEVGVRDMVLLNSEGLDLPYSLHACIVTPSS